MKVYFLFISLLFASCSTSTYLKTVDSKDPMESPKGKDNPFVKKDANKIEVFCLDSPGKEYKIIGKVLVSADAGEDAKTSIDLLKEQAAELDADGIINLRIEIVQGFWSAGILSRGTAVKYITK